MDRRKKYLTEEERRKYYKRWRENNPEKVKEAHKRWYEKNKERIKQYNEKNKEKINESIKKWQSTPYGRANHLLNAYRQHDKVAKRGECTLTTEWIIKNIFSKPCHYCGKEGWDVIGCDRIDNSKPHTPDNVVPCCYECNCKKNRTPYDEYIKKIRTLP